MVLLLGPTLSGSASASGTTDSASARSPLDCSVKLISNENNLTARADILTGCKGSHFYLESFTAKSDIYKKSFPQHLYDWTQGGSWTVKLPTCYWQVDFNWRTSPPGQPSKHVVFLGGYLGGVACHKTTTTTSSSTTSTTSTTMPTTTTTTRRCGQASIGFSAAAVGSSSACTTTTTSPRKATTTTSSVPDGSSTTMPGSTTTRPGQTVGDTTSTAPPATSTPPATPGSPSALAFTGFPAIIVAMIALALLACGLILVLASRHRPLDGSKF